MILRRIWLLLLALLVSGCNLYGGIDSPSGDSQLTSAARSCLDQNDYACAMKYYQQLSSAYSDIKNSETAYVVFDQQGATIQAFAAGFGNGKSADIGEGLTTMADQIITVNSGATARVNIYNAFMQYKQIAEPHLAALVEFLGGAAFSAEILSEIATRQNASALVTSLVSGNGVVTCTGTPAAGKYLDDGTITAATVQSAATLDLLNAALLSTKQGITNLAASGTFANTFTSAINTLLGVGCGGGTAAYNAALVSIHVGIPAQ